jgi:hypothetical protein
MDKLNRITPDYLSMTTVQIAIGFLETGKIFSTATGFIYQLRDDNYLITNWHNVTGRNPEDNQPLSDHAGIPNVFCFYLRTKNGKGASKLFKIGLYEDDEMTIPKWLVHPTHDKKVDVVALKLEAYNEVEYYPINKSDFDEDIMPEVADEAFVIGYPFEDFRYLGLPIWKKASIATEPTVNEDQVPKMLIDTATRSGLSGSPVIFQRTGIHRFVNGKPQPNSVIGRIRNFLGVYSGRIGKGEFMAQLGIVWKKEVIDEIIVGQKKSGIEFQQM